MAAPVYTREPLNYYRICYVTTDILADGLRIIFKQEWDTRYTATKGEWKDEPRNGMDFWHGESPRNQRRNARLWTTMINGNIAEWDCTMLFYAILHSDCIHSLNPVIQSNVDDLRKFRNEEFAHMPQGHLTDAEFQNAISKVEVAFQALGLPIVKTQEIRNQISFPTEELTDVLKKVDDLKQEIQVLEDQLSKDVSPFCVLPPKPSHDVAGRDCEVANITKQLQELKKANETKLSYLYISGNPGSGKSQLAGLVAKQFFQRIKESPSVTSFVMTVNAESQKTLLESYVSFARHLKCPEYAITNNLNSNDLNTEEKITNLKSLIGTKVESYYTSWLLVVDNVTSTSNVHTHLPEHGSEQWSRGQLLITTQDTQSIPLTNSFVQHISVSKGMDPVDAGSLLSMLSGIDDCEMKEDVAQALDYQPLALASAATYVKQVRQNKVTSNFGWNDYLKKLEKGLRGTTETILVETSPSYQKSMTNAITLAVDEVMSFDKVIEHTFTFLSLCALQPLSLEIVVHYIFNMDAKIRDKEAISMRIQRCSLLLFEEEESGVYIRAHQVVHDAITTAIKDRPEIHHVQAVNGAVRSFSQFITDGVTVGGDNLDSLVNRDHIVRHLKPLVIKIEETFSEQGITRAAQSGDKLYADDLEKLGQICQDDSEFHVAKKYYNLTLETIRGSDACRDCDVARLFVRIGNVHQSSSDFHQAKESYEHALSICLREGGDENLNVATIYSNLGIVHSSDGDLKQAKEYYDRALAIRLKKLGPEHVDVASAYNNLGSVHSDLGELEQAKEYYDRALAIRLKKLGPEHVHVASAYNNLGALQGDPKKAKEYYDLALSIRLEKLGPEHVDVANTCNNLGTVHRKLGDLEKAKEYYDHSLAILLKKLGPEHINVATTCNNLGNLYRNLGDLEQAKEYYHRTLCIRLKKLGPAHVDVASAYHNLGNAHSELGDLKQAKENYDRGLAIVLKKRGVLAVPLKVASPFENIPCVHVHLGNLERVKEDYDLDYDRTLSSYLNKLGPADHVDVARAYNHRGSLHRDLGDLEQARKYYNYALAIYLNEFGPGHALVSKVQRNLANLQRLEESDQSSLALGRKICKCSVQ